ncbi:hypothetical protein C5I_0138850 [Pseudomonas syringae pv. syringae FF5]|nr:hypothetical protein C5I_0138850 [Pseudomonas syringae pv. syringae FF5]
MGLQQERQLPGRLSFHMLRARSCKKIQLIIVPMLRVGMQVVTLCVTQRFFFVRWIGDGFGFGSVTFSPLGDLL